MAPLTGLGQSAVVAARTTKMTRLTEKIAKLKGEMQRTQVLEAQILATADHQISLTDPDARSMATSGRGSGVVGLRCASRVDIKHYLIITHEVTDIGTDRSQLANVATKQTKAAWVWRASMPSPTAATSSAQRSRSAKRGHHRHVAEADEFAPAS